MIVFVLQNFQKLDWRQDSYTAIENADWRTKQKTPCCRHFTLRLDPSAIFVRSVTCHKLTKRLYLSPSIAAFGKVPLTMLFNHRITLLLLLITYIRQTIFIFRTRMSAQSSTTLSPARIQRIQDTLGWNCG